MAKLIEYLARRPRLGTSAPTPASASRPSARPAPSASDRAALDYAVARGRTSVTWVHKGNIMKFTEDAFRDWGYDLVKDVADVAVGWDDCGGDPGDKMLPLWTQVTDVRPRATA